jgi:hypothetical protein
MELYNTNVNSWTQHFSYQGRRFVNAKNNKAIMVKNHKDTEGSMLYLSNRENRNSQYWTITYVDQSPKEPTSGLNRNFGFYINRPFIVES